MVCWRLNPMDVTCRDLLTPGGKNSLPVPDGEDSETVVAHKETLRSAARRRQCR